MSKMTILSAGALLRDVLSSDEELMRNCSKVYPIVSEEGSVLPYIVYRRSSIGKRDVKSYPALGSANTGEFEVICFAETEAQSLVMAERVCELLDGQQYKYEDEETGETLVARSITLAQASEDWEADAYFQQLTFTIKI